MGPEGLPAMWADILTVTEGEAGRAAADAMLKTFDTGVKKVELRKFSHPAGTWTPSPAGSPPALVSGRLRDSFRPTPARPAGAYRWMSSDKPTTVYARIQEYGGDIYPVRARFLRWEDAGGVHFAKHVHLPARPYVRTAARRMVGDGSLALAAIRGFEEAMGL